MEKGIEDEENKLYKQTEEVAENVLDTLNKPMNGNKEQTYNSKTSHTTVTINIYPQKLDTKELDNIFNYVNRKFGTQY